MSTSDGLEDVYGAKSANEQRKTYDRWSSTYEADCLSQGFRLPALGAALLARWMGETGGPVLDAGCGTGLVGETLALLGMGPVTGCDLSEDMMALAEKTGTYAGFHQVDMGVGLPFEDDCFAGFVCVGSFGPGHAPPVSLTHLARVTKTGGIGVFNVLDATYEEQGFPEIIDNLSGTGVWEIVYKTPSFRPFLLSEPDLLSHAYVVRML